MGDTFTLYRYFDVDDRLLYVGITTVGEMRGRQHAASSVWWPHVSRATFQSYASRDDLIQAERLAIRDERPIFNIAHTRPKDAAPTPLNAPTGVVGIAVQHRDASANTRRKLGRYGALKSWANTPDRAARTANGRRKAPGSVEWHMDRLDPVVFGNASPADRLAAAEAAKRAYFAALALKSAKVRSRSGGA